MTITIKMALNCETIKIYSHEIIKKLYNLLSVLNISDFHASENAKSQELPGALPPGLPALDPLGAYSAGTQLLHHTTKKHLTEKPPLNI